MSETILFVDDEPNIGAGFRRQLRGKYELETATSGEEGLKLLEEKGPYAVIVSDMRMPGMNGAEFLRRARLQAADTVRVILTGQSDMADAIAAINDGHIFRFLTKPCPAEQLAPVLESCLEQYRLVRAERELLEGTLSGAVQVMNEVLSLAVPGAFSKAARWRHYADAMMAPLNPAHRWQVGVAATLSQIGTVAIPAEVLSRQARGLDLTSDEEQMMAQRHEVAARLLGSIPRLQLVAAMISRSADVLDLSGQPDDVAAWDPVILGATVLAAAEELDGWVTQGFGAAEALEKLGISERRYPKALLQALKSVEVERASLMSRTLPVDDLRIGMVLEQDVMSRTGVLLVGKDQQVTGPMLARLHNFTRGVGVEEPIAVLVSC